MRFLAQFEAVVNNYGPLDETGLWNMKAQSLFTDRDLYRSMQWHSMIHLGDGKYSLIGRTNQSEKRKITTTHVGVKISNNSSTTKRLWSVKFQDSNVNWTDCSTHRGFYSVDSLEEVLIKSWKKGPRGKEHKLEIYVNYASTTTPIVIDHDLEIIKRVIP